MAEGFEGFEGFVAELESQDGRFESGDAVQIGFPFGGTFFAGRGEFGGVRRRVGFGGLPRDGREPQVGSEPSRLLGQRGDLLRLFDELVSRDARRPLGVLDAPVEGRPLAPDRRHLLRGPGLRDLELQPQLCRRVQRRHTLPLEPTDLRLQRTQRLEHGLRRRRRRLQTTPGARRRRRSRRQRRERRRHAFKRNVFRKNHECYVFPAGREHR
mmetsp:Transcript_11188/g.36971  ORF Transcript_11188/g.36971 Transcript_11188/m.36971 type:complete len:212 (-) Transcript_11188:227-862(-)